MARAEDEFFAAYALKEQILEQLAPYRRDLVNQPTISHAPVLQPPPAKTDVEMQEDAASKVVL